MTLSGDHAHLRRATRKQRTFGFDAEVSGLLDDLCEIRHLNLTATMTCLILEESQRRGLIPGPGEAECIVCSSVFKIEEFGQTECDPSGCPGRYGDIETEGA